MTTYKVSFNPKSGNTKTGPMPVTRTERKSCPTACPLKNNGCYADLGHVGMHWRKVEETGISWETMLDKIKALPDGTTWRHNEAGDLPHSSELIDYAMVKGLIGANKGKHGFTYTHHNLDISYNSAIVEMCNNNGFTVNLSANNLEHADKLKALCIGPVVTIVPIDHPKLSETPKGNKVVVCPATYKDDVTCLSCKLCANVSRETIIAFPVHGARKAKAGKVFMMKQG
jgi:hypothetical protein